MANLFSEILMDFPFVSSISEFVTEEVLAPVENFAVGSIESGFDFLGAIFHSFFDPILYYILFPILAVFFIILFFTIQYYLLRFYGWLFLKIFNIYLFLKNGGDVRYLISHISLSGSTSTPVKTNDSQTN